MRGNITSLAKVPCTNNVNILLLSGLGTGEILLSPRSGKAKPMLQRRPQPPDNRRTPGGGLGLHGEVRHRGLGALGLGHRGLELNKAKTKHSKAHPPLLIWGRRAKKLIVPQLCNKTESKWPTWATRPLREKIIYGSLVVDNAPPHILLSI